MRIKIKPAEGLTIRDPFHDDFLPQDGREVERNTYWIRRINEGSVILVEGTEPKLGGSKK